MGETIQLRIEMTEEAFTAAWKKECDEWTAISKKMQEDLEAPSAYDVSERQRQVMAARGEKPLEMSRIYITEPPYRRGWLIPR